MRSDRKKQRASGVYKLEPLFYDEKKKSLTVEDKTYHIDGRLGEYLVVSVPETTTRASAIDLENNLTKLAKKPVLIVTHNMEFLRAILLTGKERAEWGEVLEKAMSQKNANGEAIEGEKSDEV